LSATGRLGGQAKEETLEVLLSYKQIADDLGVSKITAAGTGALREARNASDFLQMVRQQTGINVEIISGQAEAELTALGVTRSLPETGEALILDIGGASTELAAVRKGQIRFRHTVAQGVVKLLEQYVTGDPPGHQELDALEQASRSVSDELKSNMLDHMIIENETTFISTAGTPTTLAAIDLGLKEYDHALVHGHRMTIKRLEVMLAALAYVPISERIRMGCLEPKRADLIIPGLTLTIGIMKSFGFHEMTVSDQGLLEGLLLRAAGCGH